MKQAFSEAFGRLQNSRILPVVVLLAILAAHLLSVLSLHPASLLGLSQDDTLYFSSAKALAEGRGYILPSLPGTPSATKYPILYPWLLSWIWRFNPQFPSNLTPALALTYCFALASILLAYFFCRGPLGLRRLQSLGITAFFALHPTFVFYSGRLMTDVPFTGLTLAFSLCAWRAADRDLAPGESRTSESGRHKSSPPSLAWPILSGLFASLCVFMRLAGVAFVAGVLAVLIVRKHWKRAAVFFACCTPALLYFLYQSWFRAPSPPPVPFSRGLPGWTQTWFYYTSYTAFRRLDSPNLHAAMTLLLNQVLYAVSAIAEYFVRPLVDANIALWFFATLVIAALFVSGAARSVMQRRTAAAGTGKSSPTIAVLLAYIALLLLWDYVEWKRFLLPFLPAITAVIAFEAWRCCSALRASGKDWLSRTLFAVVSSCVAGLALSTVWNFTISDRRALAQARFQREAVLQEKLEAYQWMLAHSEPKDLTIATEDGLAYLYTGRQFVNPTVLMPYGVYDRQRLDADLAHMPDVALAFHAKYWLITSGDSHTQLHAFDAALSARLEEWRGALPRVFRGSGGTVSIYDLKCLQTPDLDGCSSDVGRLLALQQLGPGSADQSRHF